MIYVISGKIIFSQRDDLFKRRNMAALCSDLEYEELWIPQYMITGMPYVTNHEAYILNGIKVGYFVYSVLKRAMI